MRDTPIFTRMIFQAFSILILSSVLGIGLNLLRKDAIPLLPSSSNMDLSMNIDMAKRLFYEKKAVFIDARPPEFYKKLHIKGAINIPPGEGKRLKNKNIPDDKIIIVYCDDDMCLLSQELAMELYFLGFDNVYYMKDGFKKWISQNLPVEKLK
ncbi:MAG: hypothetical protein DRG39_08125 [Deltaproteobacteria bacterium]|nr:MAG: hypothetical protein DRG39_08125 [Deltaproteobacteria bacterium]